MERAAKLCPFEQGCMVELHQQGRSCRDIAAELGRSKTAVNNFLRCPEAYRTKKSTCRPKNLSQQAKNAVLRSARPSSGLSAWQIAAENGLDVSKDTISRCLRPRASVEESACAFLNVTRCGAWSLPGTASRVKKSGARSCSRTLWRSRRRGWHKRFHLRKPSALGHREMVSLLTSLTLVVC